MGTSVESSRPAIAAFFDLDKTIISRSSALAFAPLFYRHGLISKLQVARSAVAQASFRLSGAGPQQLERIRDHVSALCSGWPAEKVAHLVAAHLEQVIGPLVYSEARRLLASHHQAGHDVIIVSTSGHEIVGPIGSMLGVTDVIATRMSVTDGRYTGSVEFYAYGQAKADHVSELAASRGYVLPECYAYSDSATDLPLLELVGHPRVVNADRALRRVARVRNWPQLSFRLAGTTDEAKAAATRTAGRATQTTATQTTATQTTATRTAAAPAITGPAMAGRPAPPIGEASGPPLGAPPAGC